ncbi:MAG: hypothetical protein AB8B97_12850 [Granulosicoccus sp.]
MTLLHLETRLPAALSFRTNQVLLLVCLALASSVSHAQATRTITTVQSATDDAEERLRSNSTSYTALFSSDLEMTQDRGLTQTVGVRFAGIDIPSGAVVKNAYIQFTTDETNSEPTNLTIGMLDTLDSATFTTDSFSGSAMASTTVQWTPGPWEIRYQAGMEQRTPDLSQMIQEVIEREDINGTLDPLNLSFVITGTGERTALSYDKIPAGAPKLYLQYTRNGGNAAPYGVAGSNQVIDFPDTYTLAEAVVTDDGLPANSELTYEWSGFGNNPDTVRFEPSPFVLQPTAVFAEPGQYFLQLTAYDGQFPSSFRMRVEVLETGPNPTRFTRIASASDDAEERADGTVSRFSSDLELVRDNGQNQTVGLRFTPVRVPQGVVIESAYVQFTVDTIDSELTELVIRGEDNSSASTFDAEQFGITNRSLTEASVQWSPPAWTNTNDRGVDQRTADLSPIIQEIVNRSDWSLNSSLALIISGSGKRTADSGNAELVISYRQ